VPELASRSESGAPYSKLQKRKEGQHVERIKAEDWAFPASFVTKQLLFEAKRLALVISFSPTATFVSQLTKIASDSL
jgi:hypothetical protein